jgi:hypothetical protein
MIPIGKDTTIPTDTTTIASNNPLYFAVGTTSKPNPQ